MKSFAVRIEGVTPLLCNRFTDEAQQKASSRTTSSLTGDKGTPKEQAATKLYLGITTREPMIPQPNLFRCLIDAGKFFKMGKSKVTTQKSSIIPACVEVEGIENAVEIPIESKEGWETDTRPVRIPATGGRILCHRPSFNDWALDFHLSVDTDDMAPKLLREIIDAAGRKIGLGDFRPDCKGPFGKFKVTKWVELDEKVEAPEAEAVGAAD